MRAFGDVRCRGRNQSFFTLRGADLTGEQETKTKKALVYFSKRLTADRD